MNNMAVGACVLIVFFTLGVAAGLGYQEDINSLEDKIIDIKTSLLRMKLKQELDMERMNRKLTTGIKRIAQEELSGVDDKLADIIDDKVKAGDIRGVVDDSTNSLLQRLQHQLQQLKSANRKWETSHRDLVETKQEVKALQKVVKSQADTIRSLTDDMSGLKNQVATLNESLDKLRNQTSFVGNINTECVSELVDTKNDTAKLWTTVAIQQDKIDNMTDQLKDLHRTAVTVAPTRNPDTVDVTMSLLDACEGGQLDVVKNILSKGDVDINQRGKKKRTPVMLAARNGHYEVFAFLVSQGCNLTLVDNNGNNVLHLACMGGNSNIVSELLQRGELGIDSRGDDGRTPVMFAASKGHKGLVDLLVKKGCDLTVIDYYIGNVLHVACWGGDINMVRYIVTNTSLEIDSSGNDGWTPVMIAAREGYLNILEYLVSKGSDLTIRDYYNNNVLHAACRGGNINIVRYIVSNTSVDIDSRERHGRTPVIIAARTGNQNMLEYLISKGSNLTIRDYYNKTVLHTACRSGNINMVRFIVSKTSLDINSRGQYGRTPVMIAARGGYKNMFEYLISKGSNLTIRDYRNDTVLHEACRRGDINIVRYIVSNTSININSRGQYGRTPVMIAAREGYRVNILEYLVSKGSNLTLTDDEHNNILHMACQGGHIDIVRYLLTLGYHWETQRNMFGQTPLDVARQKERNSVIDLLNGKTS